MLNLVWVINPAGNSAVTARQAAYTSEKRPRSGRVFLTVRIASATRKEVVHRAAALGWVDKAIGFPAGPALGIEDTDEHL